MLRVHLHDPGQGVRPVALGLAGQAIDQVQADVVKARLARRGKGQLRLLEAVPAADELQQVVVGGLHPHGQPGDALRAQQLQVLVGHAVGVALHSDLGVQPDIAVALEHIEDLHQVLGAVIAGGAAAEVDRVHLVVADPPGRLRQMGDQRPVIVGHLLLASGQGIEVTVAALAGAEGDMNIDAQTWL